MEIARMTGELRWQHNGRKLDGNTIPRVVRYPSLPYSHSPGYTEETRVSCLHASTHTTRIPPLSSTHLAWMPRKYIPVGNSSRDLTWPGISFRLALRRTTPNIVAFFFQTKKKRYAREYEGCCKTAGNLLKFFLLLSHPCMSRLSSIVKQR